VPTESIPPHVGMASSSNPRSLAATGGGVIAMVSGLLTIVACALPFVHYTDSQEPTSPSIFNTGFAPSNGFMVEPVGVALIAFVVGALLVAWTNRTARAIASGVLIACGVQTVLLFFGYIALAVFSESAEVGPGGLVGVLAGFLLIAAGAASLASVFARDPARAV
jgi:hypothetical protein